MFLASVMPHEISKSTKCSWSLSFVWRTYIRIRSHKLMIELSRYNHTTKDNRHRPFCGFNLIEDEVHFLFRFPVSIFVFRDETVFWLSSEFF